MSNAREFRPMKWWGWGDPEISFPMDTRPALWPWIRGKLALAEAPASAPIARDRIRLPESRIEPAFRAALATTLSTDQWDEGEEARLHHAYGKSFPDLWRIRRGVIPRAPDVVLFPKSHAEVEAIVRAAHAHDVVLVPFGGGTNIVGGVEPLDADAPGTRPRRTIATVSLRRMNRVLSVDPESRTAVIQGGALGPELERQLGELGHSLGHCPDSFEWSTLGGWIATRSAGMQSDAYGKIEDMVVAVKMVTPMGTLETRAVPASSAGPDLNHWALGSEGTLGIITEATMRVHRTPAEKDYRGYLFRSFAEGVAAIRELIDRGCSPSMIRLQDEGETELAFHLKRPTRGLGAKIQKGVKLWLARRGYSRPAVMVVGFEGDPARVAETRAAALPILKAHGGFALGKSVGKTWSADKFNVPYLRDYVMGHDVIVDVAETAALWRDVLPLHAATLAAIREEFTRDWGGAGYLGCHVSHTYETGACLYFTYAAKALPLEAGTDALAHYYRYKKRVTETFLAHGGTLTHHHAVGTEHKAWLASEISETGVGAVSAVKAALDPKRILNPGKLLPVHVPEWARAESAPSSPRASRDRSPIAPPEATA